MSATRFGVLHSAWLIWSLHLLLICLFRFGWLICNLLLCFVLVCGFERCCRCSLLCEEENSCYRWVDCRFFVDFLISVWSLPLICVVKGANGLVGYGLRAVVKEGLLAWFFLASFLFSHFFAFRSDEARPDEEFVWADLADGDLRDYAQTKALFEHVRPWGVIHLAAFVGGLFKNLQYKVRLLMTRLFFLSDFFWFFSFSHCRLSFGDTILQSMKTFFAVPMNSAFRSLSLVSPPVSSQTKQPIRLMVCRGISLRFCSILLLLFILCFIAYPLSILFLVHWLRFFWQRPCFTMVLLISRTKVMHMPSVLLMYKIVFIMMSTNAISRASFPRTSLVKTTIIICKMLTSSLP